MAVLWLWFLAGHPLDNWGFDTFLRLRQSHSLPVSSRIAHLDIGQKQLDAWSGTRQEYDGLAELLSQLRAQGAQVVVLDLMLVRGEDGDFANFWKQVKERPDVVLGRTDEDCTRMPPGPRPSEGLVYLNADRDGILRHYSWTKPGSPFPSLALAAYLKLRQIPWKGGLSLEDIDAHGKPLIRHLPARVLLDQRSGWAEANFVHFTPEQLRSWQGEKPHLQGKVVLVSYVAPGVGDLGATPLGSSVPKVSLHAWALNGLLQDSWFVSFPLPLNLLVAALLVLGATLGKRAKMALTVGWLGLCLATPLLTHWLPPVLSILLGWAACLFTEHWMSDKVRHSRLVELQLLADSEDPLILKVIGPYQIVRRLGTGGFATVYQAVPTSSLDANQSVALKIVHPASAESEEFRRRFQREVRISCQLRHPSIVTVHGSGAEMGLLYMSMELLDGRPLRHYAPEGSCLSEAQVVQLLKPMLEALDYAHGQSVVHRDLKPENLMVKVDSATPPWSFRELKIVDFGLAFDSQASALTKTGEVFGTLDYLAPERIQGSADDPRSDLYAVGVIAYELLSGSNPFQHSNPGQAILFRLTQDPPPLESELGPIVARLLARDPAERYQSARQVLDDLSI